FRLRFNEQVAIFAEQARRALAYSTSRIPIPQVVVALGHVWILAYGAYLVSVGQLNLGELVASLLIANTLIFRVEGVGRVMQTFADARSSAARIWELLDAEPAIKPGRESLPALPLGVLLQDVTVYTPGGTTKTLHNLSLQINPGEIVALVGATGSGKSTLASLLPRLQNIDSGVVAVGSDAAGWQDVRTVDLDQLRHRVQVVPQESFLFSDTLAANLCLSAPHASDEEILHAARLAAAEEIVAGLRDGMQTRIGDRGITLSGGQRQRISLARALVAKPDLLVLDDATSALDAITERNIMNNIRQLKHHGTHSPRSSTMLIIASKLSTILLADRVLVLADGHIAAQGRHEDLARSNAAYRDLLGLDAEELVHG